MKVLILDNYDSFVYNLYQAIGELDAEPIVCRNDAMTLPEIRSMDPDGIVLSPGPGHPANGRDFGVCAEVLERLGPTIPILGVCLGHQGISVAYGGSVGHAKRIVHGKASAVHHDGKTIFRGLPNPMIAGRYHSLALDSANLPADLEVSAVADDGEIMGVRHRRHPVEGVQFHPESILTPNGRDLLRNFLGRVRG